MQLCIAIFKQNGLLRVTLLGNKSAPLANSLIISLFVLFSIMLMLWILYQNRGGSKIQYQLDQFAKDKDIKLSYSRRDDFLMYGKYKAFDLQIYPWQPPGFKPSRPYLFFSVRMHNPMLKAVQVIKANPAFPEFHSTYFEKLPINYKHDFGPSIEIYTNDIMFSSILFSEDVKIDLGLAFQKLEAAAWFISGDTMGFIKPQDWDHSKITLYWDEILDLLTSVKEELSVN